MRIQRLIIVLLLLLTLGAYSTKAQESEEITVEFEALGINDFVITGLNSSVTLFFPLQDNWDSNATEIDVTLRYLISDQITSGATLTIESAGIPLSTVSISPRSTPQEVTVSVPVELISEFGLNLTISPLLPTGSDPCQAYRDPGQWMRILHDSEVTYNARLRTDAPVLSQLDNRILPASYIRDVETVDTYIVLPDASTAVELTTASEIMARLGRLQRRVPFNSASVVFASGLTDEIRSSSNLIFVGTVDNLSFIAEEGTTADVATPTTTTAEDGSTIETRRKLGEFFAEALQSGTPVTRASITDIIGEGIGYIGLFNDLNTPTLTRLVVVAPTVEKLALLGDAFAHTPTYQTFSAEEEIVKRLLPFEDAELDLPWLTSTTTLEQLGISAQRLSGAGVSQTQFEVFMPAGTELTPDSTFTVNWIASQALVAETSFMTLFMNNVPLATLKAEDANVTLPQQAEIPLPVHLLNISPDGTRSQRYTFRIEATNFFAGTQECPEEDGIWVEIQNNSFFNVGFRPSRVPDLQVFPYPFVSHITKASTAIILPENPDTTLLSNTMELVTLLGRYTTRDFDLTVITAAQADNATLDENHLILIGTGENNSVLQEVLATVEDEEENAALINDSAAFIRSINSPFGSGNTALLISGNSLKNIQAAMEKLRDTVPPIQTATGLVILNDSEELVTLERLRLDQIDFTQPEIIEAGVEATEQVIAPDGTIIVTATPAPVVVEGTPGAAQTVSNTSSTNPSPISSELSFVIIIVLAALVLPFAFALTRNTEE